MNLIIVIPTYNEKDNIRPLTQEILRIVPQAKILLVDDNSPDGTGEGADVLAKENPRITVLHRGKREGLGRAYIAGFKEALKMNPDYIIQMDADFSHSPKYIPQFLREIQMFDVVLGSRYLNNTKKTKNTTILSIVANFYVKAILKIKIKDCLGGYKCIRKQVLEKIGLERFISRGFIFQAEFIYRAHKKGFTVKEIPIIFYPRRKGKTKKSPIIILESFLKVLLMKIYSLFKLFDF